MTKTPINTAGGQENCAILFVDIEGGWGGSSRSLYYIIKHLDRKRFQPVVIMGKAGPMGKKYTNLGIDGFVFSPIPRTTAMESRNIRALLVFIWKTKHLPRLLVYIWKCIKRYNIKIIHLNHESLFFIGVCCKILFPVRVVYHIRTMLPDNGWSSTQINLAVISADYLIFISENERDLWERKCKRTATVSTEVIYNISGVEFEETHRNDVGLPNNKWRVLSLMTISYRRGTDRLIEVAKWLRDQKEEQVTFVVCGNSEGSCENEMAKKIKKENLRDFFLFLGHRENPESILANCDILIRPSRENSPWGRDVIEAMSMGKPVIATGKYDLFIENGVNGYLFAKFDAEGMGKVILHLKNNPEIVRRMRDANISKAKKLFNGYINIKKVEAIYDSLTDRSPQANQVFFL